MGSNYALEFVPKPPRSAVPNLRLYVIHTDPDAARMSLEAASVLARDLTATIEMLVPAVVPFPLPLDAPSPRADFIENAACALVRSFAIDADVRVLLCRDREETIASWIPAGAITFVGRRRSWGAGSCRRLIRAVQRKTSHLIVVDRHGFTFAPGLVSKPRESC